MTLGANLTALTLSDVVVACLRSFRIDLVPLEGEMHLLLNSCSYSASVKQAYAANGLEASCSISCCLVTKACGFCPALAETYAV